MDIETAVETYLRHRTPELSDESVRTYRQRLKAFTARYSGRDVAEIDATDLLDFRAAQQEEYAHSTAVNRLHAVRNLLEHMATLGHVDPELPKRMDVPADTTSRDRTLPVDHAVAVLDHLERYHYASRDHVTLLLIWGCGLRRGTCVALDVGDVHLDGEHPHLTPVHRPPDTTLKNGEAAERAIALRETTTTVLREYLDHNRREYAENGRAPLLTTHSGRATVSTILRTVQAWTRPCAVGRDCPSERREADCEAAGGKSDAWACPDNVTPHDVRRGAITAHLSDEWPRPKVSERMDVSEQVLANHYDKRTEREKMEQRREYL